MRSVSIGPAAPAAPKRHTTPGLPKREAHFTPSHPAAESRVKPFSWLAALLSLSAGLFLTSPTLGGPPADAEAPAVADAEPPPPSTPYTPFVEEAAMSRLRNFLAFEDTINAKDLLQHLNTLDHPAIQREILTPKISAPLEEDYFSLLNQVYRKTDPVKDPNGSDQVRKAVADHYWAVLLSPSSEKTQLDQMLLRIKRQGILKRFADLTEGITPLTQAQAKSILSMGRSAAPFIEAMPEADRATLLKSVLESNLEALKSQKARQPEDPYPLYQLETLLNHVSTPRLTQMIQANLALYKTVFGALLEDLATQENALTVKKIHLFLTPNILNALPNGFHQPEWPPIIEKTLNRVQTLAPYEAPPDFLIEPKSTWQILPGLVLLETKAQSEKTLTTAQTFPFLLNELSRRPEAFPSVKTAITQSLLQESLMDDSPAQVRILEKGPQGHISHVQPDQRLIAPLEATMSKLLKQPPGLSATDHEKQVYANAQDMAAQLFLEPFRMLGPVGVMSQTAFDKMAHMPPRQMAEALENFHKHFIKVGPVPQRHELIRASALPLAKLASLANQQLASHKASDQALGLRILNGVMHAYSYVPLETADAGHLNSQKDFSRAVRSLSDQLTGRFQTDPESVKTLCNALITYQTLIHNEPEGLKAIETILTNQSNALAQGYAKVDNKTDQDKAYQTRLDDCAEALVSTVTKLQEEMGNRQVPHPTRIAFLEPVIQTLSRDILPNSRRSAVFDEAYLQISRYLLFFSINETDLEDSRRFFKESVVPVYFKAYLEGAENLTEKERGPHLLNGIGILPRLIQVPDLGEATAPLSQMALEALSKLCFKNPESRNLENLCYVLDQIEIPTFRDLNNWNPELLTRLIHINRDFFQTTVEEAQAVFKTDAHETQKTALPQLIRMSEFLKDAFPRVKVMGLDADFPKEMVPETLRTLTTLQTGMGQTVIQATERLQFDTRTELQRPSIAMANQLELRWLVGLTAEDDPALAASLFDSLQKRLADPALTDPMTRGCLYQILAELPWDGIPGQPDHAVLNLLQEGLLQEPSSLTARKIGHGLHRQVMKELMAGTSFYACVPEYPLNKPNDEWYDSRIPDATRISLNAFTQNLNDYKQHQVYREDPRARGRDLLMRVMDGTTGGGLMEYLEKRYDLKNARDSKTNRLPEVIIQAYKRFLANHSSALSGYLLEQHTFRPISYKNSLTDNTAVLRERLNGVLHPEFHPSLGETAGGLAALDHLKSGTTQLDKSDTGIQKLTRRLFRETGRPEANELEGLPFFQIMEQNMQLHFLRTCLGNSETPSLLSSTQKPTALALQGKLERFTELSGSDRRALIDINPDRYRQMVTLTLEAQAERFLTAFMQYADAFGSRGWEKARIIAEHEFQITRYLSPQKVQEILYPEKTRLNR